MKKRQLSGKPVTHYTKSGSVNIAYQYFGSGPIDLVYIPGWISNIDWMWQCPELVDFLQTLGKLARVILFDKRGTGLSDRIVELSTLEERMGDIRAVMDAVGSNKAVLFGHSEGGSVSALFAATYPNRVVSLITFGAFAKRRYSENYPWAPTDQERQEVYDMIENYWGNGKMNLEMLAPSKANDPIFMEWLANYFRSGASPSAAMLLTKMNTQVDIIDILGTIRVPTLIMQRTHDIDVKIEEGQFLADRIEDSKLVVFDGTDHLFWVGDTKQVLREIKTFVSEVKPKERYEKKLVTVLVMSTDALDNTLSNSIAAVDQVVANHKGKLISNNDGALVVAFDGPSKAVYCGFGLMKIARDLKIKFAIGVHIMEVAMNEIDSLFGETRTFVDSLLKTMNLGQILVTQTVKFLLSGAGLLFTEEYATSLEIEDHKLTLFSVSDPNTPGLVLNNPFIDEVLDSIENYIGRDIGVDLICKDIGISERQLQRKLKSITNKSPCQFICSVKLHRAKELLLSEDFNINEVAFKTGFSSPSYFSKKFKQEFGMSPSALL